MLVNKHYTLTVLDSRFLKALFRKSFLFCNEIDFIVFLKFIMFMELEVHQDGVQNASSLE